MSFREFTEEEATTLGELIGIDWAAGDVDLDQFRMGLTVELEHGSHDPDTDVTHDDEVLTERSFSPTFGRSRTTTRAWPRWSRKRNGSRLTSCDDKAGLPTGCPAAPWWSEQFGVHPGTFEQPGRERVGVPHVAGVELVPSPHRVRDRWHQIEDELRASDVGRNADRSPNGFVRIRDGALTPSADLVAEDAEPSRPARPDRAFGDDAAFSARPPGIGADSITNRPSGTRTSNAVWYRARLGRCSTKALIAS